MQKFPEPKNNQVFKYKCLLYNRAEKSLVHIYVDAPSMLLRGTKYCDRNFCVAIILLEKTSGNETLNTC